MGNDETTINIEPPATLIGRTIIVGFTHLDRNGAVLRRSQRFGRISGLRHSRISAKG